MDQIKKKISYWYMRYLLVTELYMVEKWERNMFHVIALVLLIILGLFNYFIMVGGVRLIETILMSNGGHARETPPPLTTSPL